MIITNQLINFLNLSQTLSYSHIILTNQVSIVFCTCNTNKIYLDQKISKELHAILQLYRSDPSLIDYINTDMDRIIPICKKFNCMSYQSQIILPIVQNNLLQGLLIFLSKKEHYLPSSLKFAKTTRHFVEVFSDKTYQ